MSEIMDGKKKNTGLAEVSFSSYRSTAEEISVHKLVESAIQLSIPSIAPSVGIRTPGRLERNKIEEGEISVFDAERYFNMRLDDGIPRPDHDHNHKFANKRSLRMGNQVDDPHQMTPRRWPGTPSASSEASWNSQASLLRSFTRNRQKKVEGRSFFSNLSCTGACSDGKSVYVNQNVDQGRVHGNYYRKEQVQTPHRPIHMDKKKQQPQAKFQVKDEFDSQSIDKMSVGSNREVYYGPPALKPGLQNIAADSQLDDPRKSLEVFGSTAIKKGDITKNLERKLSMLTWDAIPNAPTISSISRSSQICDEIESDGSSDLFEIDNISGSGQAVYMRQESDAISGCMTPYAPSETSIEWSVVTASQADCSVVSDYDEKKPARSIRARPGSKTAANRVASAKALPGRSGGILGCKSQKSVMVSETAYRSSAEKLKPSNPPQFPKSINPMPARLIQADIKVKDLDFP